MQTDDLIARLSSGLAPTPRHAVMRVLMLWLAGGLVLSALAMLAWLGPRPDLMSAMGRFHFWMKFLYTLALAAIGLWLVERAARPGATLRAPLRLLAVPVLAMLLLALAALAAPGADMPALTMGQSWTVCGRNIVLVALPLLAGSFLALRRLAPTRLALAGAAAGLLAGSAGAFVYAFHCTESGAPFVAIWYSLGIAAVALIGAILGPRLLRW